MGLYGHWIGYSGQNHELHVRHDGGVEELGRDVGFIDGETPLRTLCAEIGCDAFPRTHRSRNIDPLGRCWIALDRKEDRAKNFPISGLRVLAQQGKGVGSQIVLRIAVAVQIGHWIVQSTEATSCAVPESDGASSILSRQEE
ncbi:MAG: hypothetical protein V4759_14455, partial [Pseudomonadota bacterium]